MSVAERIGMPSFLGWMVNHGLWTALIIALLISPIIVWVIDYVFESRLVGRDFRPVADSWLGFILGDPMLAIAFWLAVWLADDLDSSTHWWNAKWFHWVVIGASIVLGLLTRQDESNRRVYTPAQMWSPSKVYHDFVLYFGYAYVLVTTFVAVLFGTPWGFGERYLWVKLIMLVLIALWAFLALYVDKFGADPVVARRLAQKAHGRWNPVWSR